MHILFVSTCSRGKHWQFGAREKPVKKINIDGPGREKLEAMGMGIDAEQNRMKVLLTLYVKAGNICSPGRTNTFPKHK